MKLNRFLGILAIMLISASVLTGCGGNQSSSTSGNTSITFWAAPNPPQVQYWTEMAKEFMAQNHKITVTVKAMPETPTSEAGIQAALAGNAAPTASENVFTGFASQLAQSQVLVPLDQMSSYNQVIQARSMQKTMANWKFSDGHSYVIPMYSNPMLVGWRMDILRQIGYNQPPRTYSQVIDMGKKLQAKFPNKFVWVGQPLGQDTWYQRWFDFFVLYDAASNGHSFINGSKLTADDQAAQQSLTFAQQLSQQHMLLTQATTDPFETGVSVMNVIGPWTFPTWQQKYPNLKLNDTYVLTPPPVPDSMASSSVDTTKTFGDSKGVVIYKQASTEQQQAAWQFLKWVLSNPQHDLQWQQLTGLIPARDDLGTNPTFKSYYQQNPQLLQYAKNISNAIPALENANYTNIQLELGDDAWLPAIQGKVSPSQGWQNWKSAVQSSLGS
jgi:multiple sugar transport system substrate-binding protein